MMLIEDYNDLEEETLRVFHKRFLYKNSFKKLVASAIPPDESLTQKQVLQKHKPLISLT